MSVAINRSDEIVEDYIQMHWDIDDGEWICPEWLRDVTREFVRDYEEEWEGKLPPQLSANETVEELIKVSGLEGATCETLSEMLWRLGYPVS